MQRSARPQGALMLAARAWRTKRCGARRRLRRVLDGLVLLVLLAHCAFAQSPQDASALLERADAIKSANHAEFASLMHRLEEGAAALTGSQRQHLQYLQGWQSAYTGDYAASIRILKSVEEQAKNVTLRFRAGLTIANVSIIAARYEDAFAGLRRLLTLLPAISDPEARAQGLAVAAYLYSQVGEHDLALQYADRLLREDPGGQGACNGSQLKLDAMYKSGRLQSLGPEYQSGLAICVNRGEILHANAIRSYAARLYVDQKRYDDAIRLLTQHYQEVLQSAYPRLISEFDSLLARAHRGQRSDALAREYAQRAIEHGVKNQYTEPLITANRLLYELALERGDTPAALAFHEKYAAADKGYLDDVSARQLAYERVNHATIANELQIDALNRQNEVLQLEQALARKAAETSRLYITLLLVVIASILLWAYRTKRSQLHFMRLSRVDGLTGIANRPHFIEQAELALESSRKARREVCIVLWDLDHFKSINDKYGHATGDFVLRQTAAACRERLRTGELFGRFGGEEFCVLLPDCSPAQARQRCEELRLGIAAIAAHPGSLVRNVSASFGIASSESSGYELRQLLAHADAALYRAKRAGRNRVVHYEPMAANDFAGHEGAHQDGRLAQQ